MVGSILFARNSSLTSWVIRKLTKSKYSHCCISMSNDNTYIIEADIFKKVKISKRKFDEYEVVDIGLTSAQRLDLLDYLIKQIGKKYDYKQILGFFLRLVGISHKPNLWNSSKKMECAELVDRAYNSISIDLVLRAGNGDVMPSDLAEVLLINKRNRQGG